MIRFSKCEGIGWRAARAIEGARRVSTASHTARYFIIRTILAICIGGMPNDAKRARILTGTKL